MVICVVRDRATDSFGSPFFAVAKGKAIRDFSDELNRQGADNQLYMHPEDFDLYECGSFDTESGLFDTGLPRQLAVGKDLALRS